MMADDAIKFLSFGKINPEKEALDRAKKLKLMQKTMTPLDAPTLNDDIARMNREKALAKRRTTGRASTVLSNVGSNTLG